ncbi:MAG: zinc ABC transporter substrate-binding protein [Candidatus Omnitrophica bacterium]|nr:zinc ABC transporter substrate-binding protein [Candidatus Omnitrophota bacterium]
MYDINLKQKLSNFSFLLLFAMLFFVPDAYADKPIKIVATIGQLSDVVANVGGERVKVEGLMGAGVDPHLYKASEGDVRKLREAQIIFYNGLFLEAKMEDIFKKMQRRVKTVPVGESIPRAELLESEVFHGHFDPHIWFDVTLWQKVTIKVKETLCEFDNLYCKDYEKRAVEYLEKLTQLDQFIKTRALEISKDQRILVTAHDAFRYFGRKYDFQVKGLQGISTQSEAGINDVVNLADFIAEHKIKAIFIESSVPERNIQAVREAVKSRGWDVKIGGELFSDAMGHEGSFEGTYIGMVTHNINTIVDSLK